MKRFICAVAIVFLLLLVSTSATAATLLINQQNPYLGYGYGLFDWDNTTAALNTAFGAGNITVSSLNLNSVPGLLSFDALWITARQPGSSLSAAEQTALGTFIATGKPVVLIGENSSWSAWNNSILATVGGSYSGSDTSAILTPVLVHPLTAGVTNWNTVADGIATGGSSLFNQNVATLWGVNQNVLSILSVNAIDDIYGTSTSNRNFETNVANFLASGASSTVPEPSTFAIFGIFLAVGAGCWFYRRQRATAASVA